METKLLEIRDSMTMIIALCINMNPTNEYQRKALRRYGYPCDGKPNIMLTHASGNRNANNDPYFWSDRTFSTAHHYIIEHWNDLKEGDVVDVEFILKETPVAKLSEIAA